MSCSCGGMIYIESSLNNKQMPADAVRRLNSILCVMVCCRSLMELSMWCSCKNDCCRCTGKLGKLEVHLNPKPLPKGRLKECQFMVIAHRSVGSGFSIAT